MKYLKIILNPIKIKGNADDLEQLEQDVYEKVSTLIELGNLSFTIDDEEEDDSDENY